MVLQEGNVKEPAAAPPPGWDRVGAAPRRNRVFAIADHNARGDIAHSKCARMRSYKSRLGCLRHVHDRRAPPSGAPMRSLWLERSFEQCANATSSLIAFVK